MRLFRKNLPEKTTIENFINIPHLERVLLWFLQNDPQLKIINSEAIRELFDGGIRPKCDEDNNPDIFVKKVEDPQGVRSKERWLVIKTWLDLVLASNGGNIKDLVVLKISLKRRLDYIEPQTRDTLITVGEVANKYDINTSLNFDLKSELEKIKTNKDKEDFKYSYLSDALISSEVRLLSWIYKELFNEAYQIKK